MLSMMNSMRLNAVLKDLVLVVDHTMSMTDLVLVVDHIMSTMEMMRNPQRMRKVQQHIRVVKFDSIADQIARFVENLVVPIVKVDVRHANKVDLKKESPV